MKWLRGLFGPKPAPAPLQVIRAGWFEEWLSETTFLHRYPHYAGVLARMHPVATNTVPVMAVTLWRWDKPDSRLRLFANLAYFEKHPHYRAGVLLHEINHVVLGHLTNPLLHAVQHPRIMELAMELSADEPILEPLPDNGLSLQYFARYGIRPRQSTLERYRLLADAYGRGDLPDGEVRRSVPIEGPRR